MPDELEPASLQRTLVRGKFIVGKKQDHDTFVNRTAGPGLEIINIVPLIGMIGILDGWFTEQELYLTPGHTEIEFFHGLCIDPVTLLNIYSVDTG
jgi:hypothetical protein